MQICSDLKSVVIVNSYFEGYTRLFWEQIYVGSSPTCATIKKNYKMKKNLIHRFTPKERIDKVQQEYFINQDDLYYHSASEIKFDW